MSQDEECFSSKSQPNQEIPTSPYPSQPQVGFPSHPNVAQPPIGFHFPIPQSNPSGSLYPPPLSERYVNDGPPLFPFSPCTSSEPRNASPPNLNSAPTYIGKHGRPQKGLKWVKTSGRLIPEGAIQGGSESDNRPLFIGRGYHKGCLVIGKAAGHLGGCLIPYGGKEILLSNYHVLVGNADKLKWQECFGKLEVNSWVPLEAGNEANGVELFVAKTFYKNSEVIGKVSENMRHGMTFGYAGIEVAAKEPMVYHVLSHI